ncbi:hypothetical protein AHF37_02515, partial [Paragonimus kellicotti]
VLQPGLHPACPYPVGSTIVPSTTPTPGPYPASFAPSSAVPAAGPQPGSGWGAPPLPQPGSGWDEMPPPAYSTVVNSRDLGIRVEVPSKINTWPLKMNICEKSIPPQHDCFHIFAPYSLICLLLSVLLYFYVCFYFS